MPPDFRRAIALGRTLIAQELAARYRGTVLGAVWPLAHPLAYLAMYGFVFGSVFKARWPGIAEGDHVGYALTLFTGLLLHGLLAESAGQAPLLLRRHSNFVRKVVFPLPILAAVPLGAALVHTSVGLGLLVAVNAVAGTGLHASTIAAPLILLPWVVMLYGVTLILAALGAYVRDLAEVTGIMVTLVLFTGAVFFPASMVPPSLSGLVAMNPISWPVQALRDALLQGSWPCPGDFGFYTLKATLVLALGWYIFAKLRPGFADVL